MRIYNESLEFSPIIKVLTGAVKDVKVDISDNSINVSAIGELPDEILGVGMFLVVLGYPDVTLFQALGEAVPMAAEEALVDIEHAEASGGFLYLVDKGDHAFQQGVYAAHSLELRLGGLDVEHGTHGALVDAAVGNEVGSLSFSGGLVAVEMVGRHGNVVSQAGIKICVVVAVLPVHAFGALDEDEVDGIVDFSLNLLGPLAEVSDAKVAPIDAYGAGHDGLDGVATIGGLGVNLLLDGLGLVVFVTADVKSIDAFGMEAEDLTRIAIVLPVAALDKNGVDSKTIAMALERIAEIALIVAAVAAETLAKEFSILAFVLLKKIDIALAIGLAGRT